MTPYNTNANISIVICAYTEERWHELLAALKSVRVQTVAPREIIVVIDHNRKLFERLQTAVSGIILIENQEPRGLSGARNSGISCSQGSLIAFLDDDAIAEPDWIEHLDRCCQDPLVLGAGGVVEPLWDGKRPAWFPEEFYWVLGCTYQHLPDHPIAVRNPYGGCTCIRREVFDIVGGFRNGLGRIGNRPMGGEETELCIRATQHWPERFFLCDPHARIHHHIAVSRASWRYFMARCYAEGLSKAAISSFVGTKKSLVSERAYVLLMLPRGVLRGLADSVLRLDASGLLRATAIISGLSTTTLGYLVGRITWRKEGANPPSMNSEKPLESLSAQN
jgi:glucosyl-dolichyl phosphate glucuronosyltransferase